LDLWTAINTVMASQQIANQPGGRRWIELAGEATSMFLAHCRAETQVARAVPKRAPGTRRTET
jgi:hypothetical protein